MRMSVGVGPFRFYSGGSQRRKPPVPVAARSLGSMILRSALWGSFAFGAFGSYLDSSSSNHGSGTALTLGILIVIVQGLQWLVWLSARDARVEACRVAAEQAGARKVLADEAIANGAV
jgi:hypothetical protein